jgi:hypothetical protein
MNHDTPKRITRQASEITIELVRVQTDNIWRRHGRPPTLREVGRASGRSISQVRAAWIELEARGIVRLENRGAFRKLVAMAGIDGPHERIVRALSERGLLTCDDGEALRVAREAV